MEKLKVYYDGLCHLCSREIRHYKKIKESNEHIDFIDITTPPFDALKEGLDPFEIHKVMHVRTPDGKVHTAVDAFIEIWKVFPKYRWAAKIAQTPVIKTILTLGYHAFAKVRPYLPKVKRKPADCEDSPYCETKKP